MRVQVCPDEHVGDPRRFPDRGLHAREECRLGAEAFDDAGLQVQVGVFGSRDIRPRPAERRGDCPLRTRADVLVRHASRIEPFGAELLRHHGDPVIRRERHDVLPAPDDPIELVEQAAHGFVE